MKKEKYIFSYEGPVWRFEQLITDYIELETEATSFKEAANNFRSQAAWALRDRGVRRTNARINPEYISKGNKVTAVVDVKYCPICGERLTDGGYCPVCDIGENPDDL